MTSQKVHKLVIAAMFAALCCICTMIIKVPSIKGYTHLGDGMVILSGIILGPIYGAAAAGIGSMFADIFSGYPMYAIATLIIKALAAIVAYIVFHGICKLSKSPVLGKLSVALGGVCAGVIVTSSYFLYDMTIMGLGMSAIAGIPGNLIQNTFGIIIATVCYPALSKIPIIRNLSQPMKQSSAI